MISPHELKTIDNVPLYFSWLAEVLHQQPISNESDIHNPCKRLYILSLFNYGRILEILCNRIQKREKQCFISIVDDTLEFSIYNLQHTGISVFPLDQMEESFRLITEELKKGWEITTFEEHTDIFKWSDNCYLFKKPYIFNNDTLIRFLMSIFDIDPQKDMYCDDHNFGVDKYKWTFLFIRKDGDVIKKIYEIFKFDIIKDIINVSNK